MERPEVKNAYLQAILQGDPIKLRELYRQFFPMIKHLVRENSGTENDAKDIFQDALALIFEKAGQPNFQLTSEFSSYLFGISHNLWRNQLRKKSRHTVTIPQDDTLVEEHEWDKDYEAMERKKLYDKHFQNLEDACQEVLLLFFQKMSMKEIAKITGMTDDYSRRKKYLCQKQLSEWIKSDPIYRELT